MKPQIFFSSTSFKNKRLVDMLAEARRVGLRNIELTGNMQYQESDFELIQSECGAFNFSLHNYCLNTGIPFILNVATPDPAERRHVLNHVKRVIEFASNIGCSHYALHWGYAFKSIYGAIGGGKQFLSEKQSLSDSRRLFYLGLEELIPHAQAHGVKLLVENNSFSFFDGVERENDVCLGVAAEDMSELTSIFAGDELGLLLDFAHATVCERTLGLDFFGKQWPLDRIEWAHVSKPTRHVDSNLPLDSEVNYPLRGLDSLRGITLEVNYYDEIDYVEQLNQLEILL